MPGLERVHFERQRTKTVAWKDHVQKQSYALAARQKEYRVVLELVRKVAVKYQQP